tara:strand:- start:246 stop:683 length:438 start_codon:yes stop_codon:yes gene_type:complete
MTMDFKFSSNIFKNTSEDLQRLYGDKYDPNKNYPNFTGTMVIPRSQLTILVQYLHWALRTELKTDDYLQDVVIPVKVSGWQKESKNGKKFLSLSYSPDYKTKMSAIEAKEASELAANQPTAEQAATNLAGATAGTVVKPEETDIF